jgi:hypothetical protein
MKMKKNLLLICVALTSAVGFSQSSIPNGDFENWNSNTIENPANYPNTSNADELFHYGLPSNVIKSVEAYHGASAVELTTNASATDTVFGYFINTTPEGSPESWTGGMPYGKQPVGMRGWYKYNVASADSGTIIVAFSKGGMNIGTYYIELGGIKDSYTLFDTSFVPALSQVPDSVALGVLSCNFSKGDEQPRGPAGSTLFLDSISFTGVTAQPALLNGDFESWESQAVDFPVQWYIETERGAGFAKSIDAAKGDFALELSTYEGNRNNHAIASAGNASTGHYPANCTGNCQQVGGYPFTNQLDTLVLNYKYAPADPQGNAWLNVNLKKNGSIFWSRGVPLPAADNYTELEFPFLASDIPDCVIIDIQSSQWQDSAISYVGAKLLVDDIHFRSEEVIPTGLPGNKEDSWRVYPNPTSGWIRLEGLGSDLRQITVADVSGKIVYSYRSGFKPAPDRIDLSPFGKGVYFITIEKGSKSRTEKVVVR